MVGITPTIAWNAMRFRKLFERQRFLAGVTQPRINDMVMEFQPLD